MRSSVCGPPSGHKAEVLTVDGKSMKSRGVTSVNLRVDKRTPVVVDILTMDGDLLGFDLLLRFDVICLLGGVHINLLLLRMRDEVNVTAADAEMAMHVPDWTESEARTHLHKRGSWQNKSCAFLSIGR